MVMTIKKNENEIKVESWKSWLENRIRHEPENYDNKFRLVDISFQDFTKQGYRGNLCKTIYALGQDTIKTSIFYWNLKTYYLVGKISFYNSSDSLQDKETNQILNSLWVHRKKNGKGYPLN